MKNRTNKQFDIYGPLILFLIFLILIMQVWLAFERIKRDSEVREYYKCMYHRGEKINNYKQQMLDALWKRYTGLHEKNARMEEVGYSDYQKIAHDALIYKADTSCNQK